MDRARLVQVEDSTTQEGDNVSEMTVDDEEVGQRQGEEDEQEEEGSMGMAGGHWCNRCKGPYKHAQPVHGCPSSVEDSDRDPASHDLVLHFNGLWKYLEDEREEGKLFLDGEMNNRRRTREEPEVKDWERMERMAAAIEESATHAAEHLHEVVESLRVDDLGSGAPNAESWAEQAKIHDRMIQVGMIFAAAGAHLVGMAETKH